VGAAHHFFVGGQCPPYIIWWRAGTPALPVHVGQDDVHGADDRDEVGQYWFFVKNRKSYLSLTSLLAGSARPTFFAVAQASRLCRRRLKPAAIIFLLAGGDARPTTENRKQKTENSP